MRLTAYGCLLAALMALPIGAVAQETPNPGIEATILGQFDAFKAQDFGKAFTYASPTIKGMFGTAERFGMMVQNGYPMVAKPATVRMLELRDVAGGLWQRVMVTDQAGRTHILDYQMVETPEGWQINAVQLLPEAGVGA
jgi:hypothetical protein